MTLSSANDFYDLVISGAEIEPVHIDQLLRRQISEKTRIEYKGGAWLSRPTQAGTPGKPTEPAAKLRKWAAGFANADGGVLVVGVDAESKTWSVTGCSAPTNDTLGKWAGRALDEVGMLISPPPRVEVVHHCDGDVLVVGVRRSSQLVPCIESKERVYYVRLYDSTMAVPPYLVHDLLLGRRQHLRLDGALKELTVNTPDSTGTGGLIAKLHIQNTGLVWARNLVCGLVGYGSRRGWDDNRRTSTVISPEFRTFMDVRPQRQHAHELVHITGFSMGTQRTDHQIGAVDLAPFESGVFNLGLRLPREPPRMSWSGAIYFAAEGSPPLWFELSCQYDVAQAEAENGKLKPLMHYERARIRVRRRSELPAR